MATESLVNYEHSFDIQVDPRDSDLGSKGHYSIELLLEVMLKTIANIHIFLGKTIWQSGDKLRRVELVFYLGTPRSR